MSATSLACVLNANDTTVRLDGSSRPIGRLTAAVMRKAHGLFNAKIPAEIASRAGCSLRTAERWSAGRRVMDAEDLLALMSDPDYGADFLTAVWNEVPEGTRVRFLRQIELDKRIAAAERRRARQESHIAQMKLELRRR